MNRWTNQLLIIDTHWNQIEIELDYKRSIGIKLYHKHLPGLNVEVEAHRFEIEALRGMFEALFLAVVAAGG